MNNLPLQPLKWFDCKDGTGADTVTVICEYDIYKYGDERIRYKEEITSGEHSLDSWVVAYYNRHTEAPTKEATGFATIEEAKAWAWNHYNEKMQPYVKPMPTWVDVNEREPNEKGDYLIRDYQGRVAMGKYDKGFYMESGGEKWGCVQFWMPTPEFSTMQNLHKGGDCE